MALETSITISETTGCQEWAIVDSSGNYSVVAPINLTGYGAPNLASSAVTSATISVYKYGETVPYIFTFTIASNVITAATLTTPASVVTSIFSLLTATVFPFSTASPFVLIADWLGYGTDSSFTSGAFYVEYNVTDGTTNYTTSVDQLMICTTDCCIRGMQADLDSRGCGCSEAEMDKAMKAKMWLSSAIWAMEQGDIDKSQANLLFAQSLCEGNCGNC